MKFTVSSTDLLKQLQVSAGAIGSNHVLPILEDFLFDIRKDRLQISATDLETSVTTELPIEADVEGSVAVPGKILMDTLKELPAQPINFAIDEETFAIEIKSAFGKYKLAGENGQDFPKIPVADSVDRLELSSNDLLDGVNKTIFAVSNDELRLAMCGVYFQVEAGMVTLVATDAHKLVKYALSNVETQASASFIVPKKSLTLLKGILPAGEPVSMAFNNTNAFFNVGDIQVVSRLIDAKYPDYNAVIPVGNENKLSLGRGELLHSLKRIAVYANKTTNQVVLSLNDGSLTLSAQDLDFSNEATEQLPCTYEGDALTIGFNARFLIEMLNALDTDEVNFELSSPSRAGILLPGEQDDNQDLLMLVMPVMLNN